MKTCQQKLKNILKKYKSLKDIILFGSFVKGKADPADLDLALLLSDRSEINSISEEIREYYPRVDIEIIDSIYSVLWAVLMREGFSLRENKFLFECYGLKPIVLYKYNLKKLSPVQKVKFTRGLKTLLQNTSSEILSRTVVLVPIIQKYKMDSFLDFWNLKYESRHYELFPILRKENF